jgi:uncharacterized protein
MVLSRAPAERGNSNLSLSGISHIWVDADACPNVIKEILYRAAVRREIKLMLVANHVLSVPKSPWISATQVSQGFDVADDYIAARVVENDLVITGDIPLAAEVIEKGAHVIDSRGERLTANNIRQRLNMRDFMETMRSSGEMTGGPPPLGQRDRQAFANSLDSILARYSR